MKEVKSLLSNLISSCLCKWATLQEAAEKTRFKPEYETENLLSREVSGVTRGKLKSNLSQIKEQQQFIGKCNASELVAFVHIISSWNAKGKEGSCQECDETDACKIGVNSTRNYWGFELSPPPGVLKAIELGVSENGSVSVFR